MKEDLMWLLENSEIILGVIGFTIVAQFILHILLKNLMAWFRKAAEPDPVPDQHGDPWGDAKEPDEPSDDQDFPPLTEEDFPPEDVIAPQDSPTPEESPRFVPVLNMVWDKQRNMYACFPSTKYIKEACRAMNQDSYCAEDFHWRPATDNYVVARLKEQVRLEVTK